MDCYGRIDELKWGNKHGTDIRKCAVVLRTAKTISQALDATCGNSAGKSFQRYALSAASEGCTCALTFNAPSTIWETMITLPRTSTDVVSGLLRFLWAISNNPPRAVNLQLLPLFPYQDDSTW